MQFRSFAFTAIFCALLISASILNAATHTWTGAGGANWSVNGNWSGGAPTAAEAAPVVLVFPAAGSKFTTNDIANLTVDQIQVSGDNYWIVGSGSGANVTLRSQVFGQTFFISGANAIFTNFLFSFSTNYINNGSINISTGDTVTFRSRFTGNGGLVKYGPGTVRLQGGLPNTYSGETLVYGGILELNHSSNAIPSTLIIGNPSLTSTGTVSLLFQNQIADTANVTVNRNGVLDVDVFSEAMNSLTISNVVQVGGTALVVSNGITSYGQSSLSGIFQLAGAQRTFNVVEGQLTVTGFIENNSGTAGIKKIGVGTLQLNQDNGYNGTTLINDGKLIVANAGALGNSAFQTQVNSGGTVEVAAGISVTTEPLTLYGSGFGAVGSLILRGNSVWNGDIQLQSDTIVRIPDSNGLGTLNSTISGTGGLTKIGPGVLRLAGSSANTFAGETVVLDGTLQLGKTSGINAIASGLHIGDDLAGPASLTKVVLTNANQIADSASVYVDASGELSLNGLAEKIGPLTMRRGTITTGVGTLTLSNDILIFAPSEFLADPSSSRIIGNVSLGGVTRTIVGDYNAYLDVYGGISDGGAVAGITIQCLDGGVYLHDGPNTYSGPTDIQSGFLDLYNNATPGSASGGTIVGPNASLALRGTTVGNELLTLSSDTNVWGEGLYFGYTNVWSGPINLNSNTVVLSWDGPTARLTLGGAITGQGELRKLYKGTIVLTGSDDNTFTGGFTVGGGVVELNKSSGATAIASPLMIGDATNAASSAVVVLKAANQIANNAPVFTDKSGKLDVGTFNDTVGALTLRGGICDGTSGLLTLNGNLLAKDMVTNYMFSTVYCRLSLGGITRTFETESQAYLTIMNDLLDGGGNAGIQKIGAGNISLRASTTYSGETIIDRGTVSLSGGTLGNTIGGTTVHSNATLELIDSVIIGESLTLYGNTNSFTANLYAYANNTSSNYWGGPITLYGEPLIGGYTGRNLNLGGPISGPGGLRIQSDGDVYLTGSQPNTYAGKTTVSSTLLLNKTVGNAVPAALDINGSVMLLRPEQIGDAFAVTVQYFGVLNLNNNAETIGSLGQSSEDSYSSGSVFLGSGILTLGLNNSNTTFAGYIDGSGSLVKEGAGVFTLSGYNTYTGNTTIKNGRVNVDGSQPASNVKLMGGILGGRGTVGSITGGGAYVAPGHVPNDERIGMLKSSGLNLDSNSQFRVDLGGTVAGTDYDQLRVTNGLFILNNCTLIVNPIFAGAVSNQYTIIRSDAGMAMGTFSGLLEGATLNANGIQFKISYVGGDGNDVVLTQLSVPAPSQIGGISKLPNGQMQINGTGNANTLYAIEANANLATTNWINLGTVQADGNGLISFIDTAATNYMQRFYRFKTQ